MMKNLKPLKSHLKKVSKKLLKEFDKNKCQESRDKLRFLCQESRDKLRFLIESSNVILDKEYGKHDMRELATHLVWVMTEMAKRKILSRSDTY